MFPENFADAVRAAFSYLLDHNFIEVAADKHRVVYSRNDWSIAVFFVPFEYEVCLSIKYLDKRFEIYSFIFALAPDEFSRTYVLTAENDDQLRTSLESLSNLLRKYGARALTGDPEIMKLVASAVEAADRQRR